MNLLRLMGLSRKENDMANIKERRIIEYEVELTNEEASAFEAVIDILTKMGENDVEISGLGNEGHFIYNETDLINLSNQLAEIYYECDMIVVED